MKVQIMIYCYGIVCAAMILFNFLCIFAFKRRQMKTVTKSNHFTGCISNQLSLIRRDGCIGEREHEYLLKKLRNVGNLLAFDKSLEALFEGDAETGGMYVKELQQVFLVLADTYLQKEDVQSAYFLHVLNKYKITDIIGQDSLIETIKKYFNKSSIYCSLYAMEALCFSGRCENALEGLKILNLKESYFDGKLIVRELSLYRGDKKILAEALMRDFNVFSVSFKTAIVDFLASLDLGCEEFVYKLLTDDRENDEVRYSSIRYFGKHEFRPAIDTLKDFANSRNLYGWVYVSQAVTAISHYPDEEVIRILKKCLSSSDWYVRYNAAVGLDRLGITYNGLADIINGNDRYAKEIVTYMTEHKSLHESEQKGKETVLV